MQVGVVGWPRARRPAAGSAVGKITHFDGPANSALFGKMWVHFLSHQLADPAPRLEPIPVRGVEEVQGQLSEQLSGRVQ